MNKKGAQTNLLRVSAISTLAMVVRRSKRKLKAKEKARHDDKTRQWLFSFP
jgi:hypothetical protein